MAAVILEATSAVDEIPVYSRKNPRGTQRQHKPRKLFCC